MHTHTLSHTQEAYTVIRISYFITWSQYTKCISIYNK